MYDTGICPWSAYESKFHSVYCVTVLEVSKHRVGMPAIELKLLCAVIQLSFMSYEQNYAHSVSSVCLCSQEPR